MSELSPNTKSVVEKLFKSREAKEVCDMLEIDCGTESLGCEGWTPEQMERIRFAVLKFGGETDEPPRVSRRLFGLSQAATLEA